MFTQLGASRMKKSLSPRRGCDERRRWRSKIGVAVGDALSSVFHLRDFIENSVLAAPNSEQARGIRSRGIDPSRPSARLAARGAAASRWITPSWHHRMRAPLAIASSAISGTNSERRNTSTISTGSGIDAEIGIALLARALSSASASSCGLTGITLKPWLLSNFAILKRVARRIVGASDHRDGGWPRRNRANLGVRRVGEFHGRYRSLARRRSALAMKQAVDDRRDRAD